MRRASYIFLLAFVLIGTHAMAQQQVTYTNFLLNRYYFNPAIAGSEQVHVANLSYRTQWTGFAGAPKTLMGNLYGSHRNQGVHGYGGMLMNDATGMTQRTGFYVNYAYHIKLSDKVKLGLGLQPGYAQYRITLYNAILADQGDEVLTGNVLSQAAFDVNGGFHLYSDKFFFMGSVNQLLGKEIKFTAFNVSLRMHYTVIGGYNFLLGKKKSVELQPSVLVRYTQAAPFQYNPMIKTTFHKKYWFGLGYRSDDAASACLGYQFKERLNIGYAYDYSMSKIQAYQSGSHEITISYVLTSKKPSIDEKDEELNNSIMDELKKKKPKE